MYAPLLSASLRTSLLLAWFAWRRTVGSMRRGALAGPSGRSTNAAAAIGAGSNAISGGTRCTDTSGCSGRPGALGRVRGFATAIWVRGCFRGGGTWMKTNPVFLSWYARLWRELCRNGRRSAAVSAAEIRRNKGLEDCGA